MNRAAILYPNAKAERGAQYPLAWGLLLGHLPHVTEVERAQARCWLTYRCAEGEVPYGDYLAQVEPVKLNPSLLSRADAARWQVSIMMADVCALLMHGEAGAWLPMAQQLWQLCRQGPVVKDWQPCVLAFVRVAGLLAYDEWLKGQEAEGRARVQQTWDRYKAHCQEWNWQRYPLRALEALDDMRALQVLQFVGMQLGLVVKQESGWCKPETLVTASTVRDVPFMRCLAALSERAIDAARVIFPPPTSQSVTRRLFRAGLTEDQHSLWEQVRNAGVTHVPVALGSTNLGDDIQSLAALKWCGLSVEDWVSRDNPGNWPAGSRVLLCGWYGGAFLPPASAGIEVVVCGFHLHPLHVEAFQKAGLFAQLKEHVERQGFPAGCRDTATVELLTHHGIEAVWSGCPSETLRPVAVGTSRHQKLAIDAPPPAGWVQLTHRIPELATATAGQRLKAAEEQIKILSSAAALLTTRLHAALPAAAMGCSDVRVIFNSQTPNPGRWSGYLKP